MDPTTALTDTTGHPSDEKHSNGRWTKEEHQRFVEAIKNYGKNWKKVEDYVGTRSGAQIRSHAQKFFLRLEKELKAKQSNQKDKGVSQSASARKFSEGSISTNQTHQDEISDSERLEDHLKENLPIHEEAENQPDSLASPNTITLRSKQDPEKDTVLNTQGSASEMQAEATPEKSSKETLNSELHLLNKLQNSQKKQKEASLLFNLLSDHSTNENFPFLRPPINSKTTTPTTTTAIQFRSPISGELHPHHSVYIDLMNYFTKYNKNTKTLKLSDMVELSPEKSTSDDETYEFPVVRKIIKQL